MPRTVLSSCIYTVRIWDRQTCSTKSTSYFSHFILYILTIKNRYISRDVKYYFALCFKHICCSNKFGQVDLILVEIKDRSESLILRRRIGSYFWNFSSWAFVWESIVNKIRLPGDAATFRWRWASDSSRGLALLGILKVVFMKTNHKESRVGIPDIQVFCKDQLILYDI